MVYTSSSSSSSSGASDSEVSDVEASDEPVVGSIPETKVIACHIRYDMSGNYRKSPISDCISSYKTYDETYHSRVSRFDLVQKSLSIARADIFPFYK